ncbi:hypothetical protein DFH28DRAFT_971600 [Melampsora americana]|nr:hypothetical protein DFH28DRAFT_971600 [Melampsora americana]
MTSNHSQSSHGFFTIDQTPNFPPPLLYPQFAEPTIYLPSEPSRSTQHLSSISNLNHDYHIDTSQNQSSAIINSLATLGKDGDVKSVRKELCILFEEVEYLITETDVVFSSIEQIYTSDPSPMITYQRLKRLLSRYERLINDVSISGFGGLPIDSLYNLHTLLQGKEREVQALYIERQKRRDGSNIVMGILQSVNNSNGNHNTPSISVTTDTGVV